MQWRVTRVGELEPIAMPRQNDGAQWPLACAATGAHDDERHSRVDLLFIDRGVTHF
jgi:hypothetical protein